MSDISKHSSRSSRRSAISKISSKAEAEAEIAEMTVRIKYADIEAEKRKESDKLEFEKKIEIARARMDAFEKSTRDIDPFSEIQEQDKNERVREFIEKHSVVNSESPPILTPINRHIPPPRYDKKWKNSPDQKFESSPDQKLESSPEQNLTSSPDQNLNSTPIVKTEKPKTCNHDGCSNDFANMSKSFSDVVEQIGLNRLPPPQPGVFTGDPLQYTSWRTAFDTLIERRAIPSYEKTYYLKRYVSGEALESISGYLDINTEDAYKQAKAVLDKRFGSSSRVSGAFRDKLESWPVIYGHDGHGLRKFGDFLLQCQTGMKTIKGLSILSDERENRKMLRKLPDWLVYKWGRTVDHYRSQPEEFPPFSKFVDFVCKEADILCDPVMPAKNADRSVPRNGSASKRFDNVSHSGKEKRNYPGGRMALSTGTTPPSHDVQESCTACGKDHDIETCKLFLEKSLEERQNMIREKNLCFACLERGHQSKACTNRRKCKSCDKSHPTVLHIEFKDESSANMNTRTKDSNRNIGLPKSNVTSSKTSVSHLSDSGRSDKCSMILPVWLSHKDTPETERLVYALLDTQSDTTFIADETCCALGLNGPSVKLMLSTMTSQDELVDSRKIVDLQVRGYDCVENILLPPVYSRGVIPANMMHVPTPDKARQWPHLEQIVDKLLDHQEIEVGLLIGYNCSRALMPREIVASRAESEPYGQRTDLGWGIVGIINPSQVDNDDIGVSHRLLTLEVPQNLRLRNKEQSDVYLSSCQRIKENVVPIDIVNWMSLDFIDHKDTLNETMSYDDKKFLEQVGSSIHYENGHYVMPLPFKTQMPVMPDNKNMAMKRLDQLKRRLKRDEQYAHDYKAFMQNIVDGGHAERVPASEVERRGDVWYIPHHGVNNPKKPGKIRVVFDCSASHEDVSINDKLLQGPDLTNTLVGVLCRFRKENIAVMCDVEQMFHQFKVDKSHRNYLRFLWWDTDDFDLKPVEYRMTVHLFGATSSPGCANFGLKQVANDNEEEFGTDAANFVRRNFYVDDGLVSVPTVNEATDLIKRSKDMCQRGGLRLHKFISNSKEVISEIPPEDHAKGIKDIDLLSDSLPLERALGVSWCVESDCFRFKIALKDQPCTRRGVLATINSIYDPLGIIAPVALEGKQILQEACKDNLDWDIPLPDHLQMKWENWKGNLHHLENIDIQRCFKPDGFEQVVDIEIHHFSDASTTGYGQVSYLRLIDDAGEAHCSFVMGKARVAPLKSVTIPRLELTAAVVSVKIAEFLRKELDFDNLKEYFWTDSKVVLGYVANDSKRFHVFVANRVEQIRSYSDPSQWSHVISEENPADVASRAVNPAGLQETKWLTGPDFLWQNTTLYSGTIEYPLITEDPEVKKVKVLATSTKEPENFEFERLNHCSSWNRARKAVVLCLKLKHRLHHIVSQKDGKRDRGLGGRKSVYESVDVDDLQKAETLIVKCLQRQVFPEGANTKSLRKLDPFMDSEGLLCVVGRIRHASLSDRIKHPVVLPRKHHITTLILRHFHEIVGHQGRGITVNKIRSNGYWIISCGSAVSYMISKCVKCRKFRSCTQGQKMANLPVDRMEEAPPFTYCGVDIFGPFLVKEGRHQTKRYGALFTCLVCRAVHIEVVCSMSTDSFVNALRRFMALRGPVRLLRCDQGTNFVGAKRELQLDIEDVRRFLQGKRCDFVDFQMNVPSASHFGGAWERMIRTVRNVLTALMDQAGSQLDDECLRTLLCEVMNIVNSRPLTLENLNDPLSMEPLTPNHLLTLKTDVVLPPPGVFQRDDKYCKKQWKRVQHLTNQFWHRWRTEFLQLLQVRQKWLRPKRLLQCGDIVIVKDDNQPRNTWQMAKVVEVFKDDDGLVRKCKLVCGNKSLDIRGRRQSDMTYYERPVHKLVLLLESEE